MVYKVLAKKSLEPDLNQRPMDNCLKANYSPPLYQLSYRGWSSRKHLTKLTYCITDLSVFPGNPSVFVITPE